MFSTRPFTGANVAAPPPPVDPWAAVDGSPNAPVVAAGPQFPTLLNSYGGGSTRNRNIGTPYQPPWQVPGVDYPVGINDSAKPLKPVNGGGLPSGAAFASGEVTITGNNVVLDGWDFSVANGCSLTITGNNCTVKNCFFKSGSALAASGSAAIEVDSTAGTTTIQYCEFDGTGASFPASLCIAMPITGGICVCTYNYIHNWNDDSFRVESFDNPTGSPANRRFVMKYNLLYSNGYSGVHNDCMQTVNASYQLIDMTFNTMYQPTPVGGLPTETTGFRNSDFGYTGDQGEGGLAAYNVYIGKGSTSNITFSQIFAISGTGSGLNHFALVHDNYIDGTGLQNTASIFTSAGNIESVNQYNNWDMSGTFSSNVNSHNPTGYMTADMVGSPSWPTRPGTPTLSTATASGSNVAITGTAPSVPTGGIASSSYLINVWALDLAWQSAPSVGNFNGSPTSPLLIDWTHTVAPGGAISFTTGGQTLPAGTHTIAIQVIDWGTNQAWNSGAFSTTINVTI